MATVEENMAEIRSYIDEQKPDFERFVDDLHKAIEVNFDNIVGNFDADVPGVSLAFSVLDNIQGAFPEPPEVAVPDYQVPEIPDISFTPIDNNIDVLEAARQKLLGDLEDGTYGIDTNDEQQLLDRARDRAVEEAETAVAELERSFQNRGFSVPPGTMWDPLEMARQAVRRQVSDTNRDIYIKRADQFFQARQFAISAGGTLDQQRASIKQIQFQVELAQAQFLLESFRLQFEKYRVQIAAAIDKASLLIRVFEAQSSVTNSRIRAASEQARVFIADYDSRVRAYLGEIEANLQNGRNRLEAEKAAADLSFAAADTGARVFSSVISSGLGAQSTLVSQSSEESAS